MEQDGKQGNILECTFDFVNTSDSENIIELLGAIPHTKSETGNGQTHYAAKIDLSDAEQMPNAIRFLYGIEHLKHKQLVIKGKHVRYATAISVLECYLHKLTAPNRMKSSYCTGNNADLRIQNGESFAQGVLIRTDKVTLPCKQIEDFDYGVEWWRFGHSTENAWVINKGEIAKRLDEMVDPSPCGWCPGFERSSLEAALDDLPKILTPQTDTSWDWRQSLDGHVGVLPTFRTRTADDNWLSSRSMTDTENEEGAQEEDEMQTEEPSQMGGRKQHGGFDLIGGLGPVIQQLREVFELPLRKPETFKALGVMPPKAALLVGPPGTGKTLLARAISSEISAQFIAVAATELIGSYVGETERNIRNLFARAKRKKPAIIFIDEIDAITADRARAERSYEVNPLNQLLVLMDGFNPLDGVGLLFATNRLEVLDPAFYRPGRIDKVIAVSPPNEQGRYEILQIYTKKMPLDADVSLQSLAEMTTDLTGAELQAIVQEAGIRAIRRADSIEKANGNKETPEILVTSEDFAQALTKIIAKSS